MDDLDVSIREATAKDPRFPEFVSAFLNARQLIRELAAARERAGLTQAELARRMATTQPVIARLESGDIDPRLSTVTRYAQALDLNLWLESEVVSKPPEGA